MCAPGRMEGHRRNHASPFLGSAVPTAALGGSEEDGVQSGQEKQRLQTEERRANRRCTSESRRPTIGNRVRRSEAEKRGLL